MLVIQGSADRVAPRADSADVLAADFPDRVTVALIDQAGHALLPEQPDAIAGAIVRFLSSS